MQPLHRPLSPPSPTRTPDADASAGRSTERCVRAATGQDRPPVFCQTARLAGPALPSEHRHSLVASGPGALDTAPAAEPGSGLVSTTRLQVNFVPACHPVLAQQIAPPPSAPLLLDDMWLSLFYQLEHSSVSFVEDQLQERRRQECLNQEFCFAPLIITLENMQTFLRHIRAGHQFRGALTAAEDRALAQLETRTAALLAAGAPYARSVHLALAVMTLVEMMTDRQVLGPLRAAQPRLFDRQIERVTFGRTPTAQLTCTAGNGPLCANELDAQAVAALDWGGNNPGGDDEKRVLFGHNPCILAALTQHINDHSLLLFPSFYPLTGRDLCRLAHLPLHPIRMITCYLGRTEGLARSPLSVAVHDLGHLHNRQSIGRGGPAPGFDWHCPAQRLLWRRLLLERIPAPLAPLRLEPALNLVLLTLLHQYDTALVTYWMSDDRQSFLHLLRHILNDRRHRLQDPEQNALVTDAQCTTAVAWTIRLWQHWQATGLCWPVAQLDAVAECFVTSELPRLEQHLAFVEQHRDALRQLFCSHCRYRVAPDGSQFLACPAAFGVMESMTLFSAWNPRTGLCNLDNTDLVYLALLHSPRLRQAMAKVTGSRLPEGLAFDYRPPGSTAAQPGWPPEEEPPSVTAEPTYTASEPDSSEGTQSTDTNDKARRQRLCLLQ